MTTLSDIRDRVRLDLRDPDSERWSDDQLDRHITRALHDMDRHVPREAIATIATTSGSRDIDLSTLTGLIDVESAEYPVDEFPPCYVQFSRWDQSLTLLLDTAPDGTDVRLGYTATHTLDGSGLDRARPPRRTAGNRRRGVCRARTRFGEHQRDHSRWPLCRRVLEAGTGLADSVPATVAPPRSLEQCP